MTLSPLDRKRLELVKLRRQREAALVTAFDGENPKAQPTPAQDAVLRDTETLVHWIVSSNRSGKSQTGSRVVSWWFMENHPYMTRPATWKGTLQILVVGAVVAQMEAELWNKKLKPLLPPGSYRMHRTAGVLQRVTNLRNGNEIIFMSHHDAINARKKVQAFTAHVVWLDEMPDHAGLVTELMMRTLTTGGRLYGTFTPLLQNAEIYKIVNAQTAGTKTHKFLMLDNPIFRGKEAETLAAVKAMCASEAEFRCRAYGEWWGGEQRVFAYDPRRHRAPLPVDYHPRDWRHVAVADPSASGLTGLTVWAEDPKTGRWYNVLAKKLKGEAAFDLFNTIEGELAGYGVVARWTDCNPAGFYKEAARRGPEASGGMSWVPYTEKQDRKLATIDKLNTAFLQGELWLTDASDSLEEDLVRAEWSDRLEGKLVNASRLHLADTARYFNDVRPKFDPHRFVARTQDQEIREAWHSRRAQQAKAVAARRAKVLQRKSMWARPTTRH